MKILIVEPMEMPRPAEIKGDLKSMQRVVGGLIQALYPFDDPVALVCNDEGKLDGLPLNRQLGDDIIAGTFFICGLGDENFDSLPPEMLKRYTARFARPEIHFPIVMMAER